MINQAINLFFNFIEKTGKLIFPNYQDSRIYQLAQRIFSAISEKIFGLQPAFYFPNSKEVRTLSFKQLHQIWNRNNETLIGIIASHKIPLFGYHSTDKKGLEGIQASRQSKGVFYLAGFKYQLDPITFLADLYTMAAKTADYLKEDGGVFIIGAEKACNIDDKHITCPLSKPDVDPSTPHAKFVELIGRRNCKWSTGKRKGVNRIAPQGTRIKTNHLHPAIEQQIDLQPEHYARDVKGIFLADHSLYFRDVKNGLGYQECQQWYEQVGHKRVDLVKYFFYQELILNTFQTLQVVQKDLVHYHQIGKKLIAKIDKVTTLTEGELRQIKQNTRQIKHNIY